MSIVVVTGASSGIGLATVQLFLARRHTVYGIDIKPAPSHLAGSRLYKHFICDVSDESQDLPDLEQDVAHLINCAGIQEPDDRTIDVNLKGLIRTTEKYGVRLGIKSIVNVASASAHTGAEFPQYAASKGGVLAYTKNVAMRVAKYGATCNSISPGGVITESNARIIYNAEKWAAVKRETLLNRWATAGEIAEWIYFMSIKNKSMTGQDIIVDNGEMINYNFVW